MRAPASPTLRSALPLALVFAAIKLALQVTGSALAQHAGYGIFRDELYYLVCGRNLAWGYLDQPPLVAVQARVSELLFGLHSLALLRLLTGIAGAIEVALTVLLAAALGGNRLAQSLAALGVLCSPIILGVDANMSMNAVEPVFWIGIALALALLARRAYAPDLAAHVVPARPTAAILWLIIGALAGLGLLNKWNIAFFLLSAAVALLISPQRRLLATPWLLAASLLATALFAPNLLWEAHRHWPTLEWLHNDATGDKNIHLGPVAFVLAQIQAQNPVGFLLWFSGLLWLLFARAARPFRFFGLTYVVYLPAMIAMHAKDYYLAPIYPILFAAGGCAFALTLTRPGQRRVLIPAYITALVAVAALAVPLAIPVLPPARYIAYTHWLGHKTPETQTFDHAPLPQYFADMLGWREKADAMAAAYHSLSPQEQAEAVLYTTNYGGASAINIYHPELPIAISGHQNYWFWGPRGHSGEIMIIYGDKRADDEREFAQVTDFPWHPNPYTEPYEQKPIYICRHPRGWTLPGLWPKIKEWY